MIIFDNVKVDGLDHAIISLNSLTGFSSRYNNDDFYKEPHDVNLDSLKLIEKYYNKQCFLQKITVSCDIIAPLYWWREFNVYKSSMIQNSYDVINRFDDTVLANSFKLNDFSHEQLIKNERFAYPLGGGWRGLNALELLQSTIEALNRARNNYLFTKDRKYWWQIVNLLPSSYNQKCSIIINYGILAKLYNEHNCDDNLLSEWDEFCGWIEHLPYHELITNNYDTTDIN